MDAVLGGETIVTTFLMGELCRAPDGLLCLFDLLRDEGREEVLLRVGEGVVRAVLGALTVLGEFGVWRVFSFILCCGLTGTT